MTPPSANWDSEEDRLRIIAAMRETAINGRLRIRHWNDCRPTGFPAGSTLVARWHRPWSEIVRAAGLEKRNGHHHGRLAQFANRANPEMCECYLIIGGAPKRGRHQVTFPIHETRTSLGMLWLCDECYTLWQEDEKWTR